MEIDTVTVFKSNIMETKFQPVLQFARKLVISDCSRFRSKRFMVDTIIVNILHSTEQV